MSHTERALLKLLQERCFQKGNFKLASGETSTYYVDGKSAQVFSESAFLIGEVIYEHTRDLEIDAIGGLEIGAIPLTTAVVISYHQHGRKLEGFWVRAGAKDHGTKKIIEGRLPPGARVVIVDDVFTTGGSAQKAAEEVKKQGGTIVLVLALVDRLRGAEKLFQDQGIPYRAIFTIRDFGVDVEQPQANTIAVG